jgi:hypothetical protein
MYQAFFQDRTLNINWASNDIELGVPRIPGLGYFNSIGISGIACNLICDVPNQIRYKDFRVIIRIIEHLVLNGKLDRSSGVMLISSVKMVTKN